MKNNFALKSLGHAALTVLYVVGIVLLMNHLGQVVGEKESIWFPILGLILFVFSAAITGSLVLGRPLMFYLDGKKGEAVRFFGYTLGWLFAILAVALVIMLVVLR